MIALASAFILGAFSGFSVAILWGVVIKIRARARVGAARAQAYEWAKSDPDASNTPPPSPATLPNAHSLTPRLVIYGALNRVEEMESVVVAWWRKEGGLPVISYSDAMLGDIALLRDILSQAILDRMAEEATEEALPDEDPDTDSAS